jgi:hypothetical protein
MMIQVRFIHSKDNNLDAQGYTLEQQHTLYDAQLEDVISNPRWYLDNLLFMREYKVQWKDYSTNTPTLPFSEEKTKHL